MPVEDGDILRIVAKMSFSGNDVQNVYHGQVSGDQENDTTIMSYIGDWLDDMYTNLSPYMDPAVTFDTIAVYNVTTDTLIGEDDWPVLTAGTSEDESLPRQCSPVVRFPTTQLRSQCRKFYPPTVDSSASTNGIVGQTLLNALGAAASYVVAGVDGLGWDVVLGAWNPELARFAPIVESIVNGFFGTQRRRNAGVGS